MGGALLAVNYPQRLHKASMPQLVAALAAGGGCLMPMPWCQGAVCAGHTFNQPIRQE